MSDPVRRLTSDGIGAFRQYIARTAAGEIAPVPTQLLTDPRFSETVDFEATVERTPFSSRYELGVFLQDKLKAVPVGLISRDHGLWTWLALYWFDQVAPERADKTRRIYRIETLVLPERPDYSRYYRHFIRTPWLAAQLHGQAAKVLLIPTAAGKEPPLTRRGELVEQLGSRQWVFGNHTIIQGAYNLYFDPALGRPRRGAGGSGGGSPRRLATIVDQLELTWDLQDCTPEQFVALLPKEFDKWRAIQR